MPLQEAPLARWLAAKPDDEVTGRIRMALTKRDDLRGDRAPGESPSIGTLGMVSRRVRLHVLGHRTLVVGDAYLTSICPERPHGMLALYATKRGWWPLIAARGRVCLSTPQWSWSWRR